jgi:hypothetical protein
MFSMFSILSSNSFSLYYVSLDNKDRSDQTDRRKGNRNLCAAVFSFFHSTAIPTVASTVGDPKTKDAFGLPRTIDAGN